MNLTLYHITPFVPDVRPLYVLAPDPSRAVLAARHCMPGGIRNIEAIANNAYQGEAFPRFVDWVPECRS